MCASVGKRYTYGVALYDSRGNARCRAALRRGKQRDRQPLRTKDESSGCRVSLGLDGHWFNSAMRTTITVTLRVLEQAGLG